jgi:hypothetical protein
MRFCSYNVGTLKWHSPQHPTQLEASHLMRDANLNDAITKLYDKVDIYSAEDWCYLDVALAIQLCKPL